MNNVLSFGNEVIYLCQAPSKKVLTNSEEKSVK